MSPASSARVFDKGCLREGVFLLFLYALFFVLLFSLIFSLLKKISFF